MKDKKELEESAADIKRQFDELEAERKQLVEQRTVIDRRLSEIGSSLVEARGLYRGLMYAQGLDVDGSPLEEPVEEVVAEVIEEKKTPKSKPS